MFSGECIANDEEDLPKKLILNPQNISNFIAKDNFSILEFLFSSRTKQMFDRFKISMDFLKSDPNTWHEMDDYKKGKYIIDNLKVVNDCAERGIKLIQEYHEQITKDEDQRQHLFKVIAHSNIVCF